ncbi:DUF2029 domain-containing protein [Dyella lutea]|uniref:DUF2029 domain-containing protein n=1 Tax=Dyella lutea TaxID=2950441 RepID=A0ABT1FFK0_9GAMM|nr:DUF2029 domain-containing protein [Dyella lutea]MCP1376162.1 DUF2029 domain-containing protein [Dyella lutea]
MTAPRRKRLDERWPWVLGGCLAAGTLLALCLGQDASWDLRNYHLYNAWAWLNGRESIDIAAAGLQSWFNPALDLPYYLLATGPLQHAPRWLAALQGLWFGLLAFLVFRIAATFARLQRRRFGTADAIAVAIGVTGTMAVSQTGLTTNELPTACLVLAGIALLLHALGNPDGPPWRTLLLAGLCTGLAAGLKPTAIVYPVAAGFAAAATLRPWRCAGRGFIALALGSGGGFLLAYGWWGWHLYQSIGNPAFPMFNQWFHSPWAPATSMTDTRFLPRSPEQWLAYPFYWLRRNQALVTEARFADPRYALAFLAVLALPALRLWSRRDPPGGPALGFLAVFWALAYLQWLGLFSILRYAIPLESLSGVMALGVLRRAWPDPDGGVSRTARRAIGACALLCLALTHYPNWGRVPFSRQPVEVSAPRLPAHSLVMLVGMPLAYLPPLLPQDSHARYVGLNWFTDATRGYRLYDAIEQAVRAHNGPRYALLSPDATTQDQGMLGQLLPGYRLDDCRPVTSNLERDRRGRPPIHPVELCRMVPAAPV